MNDGPCGGTVWKKKGVVSPLAWMKPFNTWLTKEPKTQYAGIPDYVVVVSSCDVLLLSRVVMMGYRNVDHHAHKEPN